MAFYARLITPPTLLNEEWPWHTARIGSFRASAMWSGDRRMEAEAYLSSGYGLRLAIQGRDGWAPFASLAKAWQPARLKGIIVSPEYGTPFLAATQVFDLRPVARKWLALSRTHDSANRFLGSGTIVVTCSGAVGRATFSHNAHEGMLISHDLLRIVAHDPAQRGWIYSYLRSAQARAMMTQAKYGHIIKHLETSHLASLPIPVPGKETAQYFLAKFEEVIRLRSRAFTLNKESEIEFEKAVGAIKIMDVGEVGFSTSAATALFTGRRRLDAAFHNPSVQTLREYFSRKSLKSISLEDAGLSIWLPNRFKRIPAVDGVELVESSSIFEVNPDFEKRIADINFGDGHNGRVRAGWLLMARSGQVYGINGNIAFATKAHEDKVVSDDLIRIAPGIDTSIDMGYLYVALSHPLLGRPLIKALPYGSSIPHIDVSDLQKFHVIRLASPLEESIGHLAKESAACGEKADLIERALGRDASALMDRFIAGEKQWDRVGA